MEPVYCRKCRAEIAQSDAICPKCGWDQSKRYDKAAEDRLALAVVDPSPEVEEDPEIVVEGIPVEPAPILPDPALPEQKSETAERYAIGAFVAAMISLIAFGVIPAAFLASLVSMGLAFAGRKAKAKGFLIAAWIVAGIVCLATGFVMLFWGQLLSVFFRSKR